MTGLQLADYIYYRKLISFFMFQGEEVGWVGVTKHMQEQTEL